MASDMVLSSQRVLPAELTAAGFTFAHPDLDGALRSVLGTG
jgi:NAD dependent epimerase/dehydratase family enzyme